MPAALTELRDWLDELDRFWRNVWRRSATTWMLRPEPRPATSAAGRGGIRMKADIDSTVVYPHPPERVWAALTRDPLTTGPQW